MMSNDMMRGSAKEEYLRAQSAGLREKRELEAQGLSPYPTVLEEAFPGVSKVSGVSLPLVEIPADRIVGTVTSGRKSTFSASFLPLPEVGSEFSAKWIALCEAHLSDTGIRDPIECIEYLGNFYVREGNKRVSVLRWFGAVRIPAKVRRVMPLEKDSPRAEAYEEFLDFFKATGIYDIQFTKPGKYAKLLTALGKKPGDPWTEQEKKRLVSAFTGFKEAFAPFKSKDHALLAEDALLLFLKVYPFGQLTGMTRQELKKALSALWPDIVTTSDSGAITVKTTPDDEKKKSVISKLIAGTKHLNAAFICQNDTERSAWTRGHAEGAAYLAEALGDSVSVKTYFHADTPEDAERLIGEAVSDGADLVFTTTPQLLDATLKAAVKHPKVGFYNCSACQLLLPYLRGQVHHGADRRRARGQRSRGLRGLLPDHGRARVDQRLCARREDDESPGEDPAGVERHGDRLCAEVPRERRPGDLKPRYPDGGRQRAEPELYRHVHDRRRRRADADRIARLDVGKTV